MGEVYRYVSTVSSRPAHIQTLLSTIMPLQTARMTKAPADEWFLELRHAMKLSQDDFALRSNGNISRNEVINAEKSRNRYRTEKWTAGIAAITGASHDDVHAWRAQEIGAAELLARGRGDQDEDAQYPARGDAARRLRGVIDGAAIDAVREEKFKGAEALTVLDWMDRMRAEHADRVSPGKKVGRTVAADDGKPSRAAQLIRSRR